MMTTTEDIPWIEKYRPQRIEDVSHQESVKRMLRNVVKTGNMPHCLFYGPPGTGKTSAALALCRELFGDELRSRRVMELNASDDRGIAVVREKIKMWTRTAVGVSGGSVPTWKVVILDEADMMTGDAQSALRRIMEDNAKSTRSYDDPDRIIDPIASRCAKYRFEPISRDAQMQRLHQIAIAEQTDLTQEAFDELLDISEGDLRVAVMVLQSCSSLFDPKQRKPLTAEIVQSVAGFPPSSISKSLLESASKCKVDDLVRLEEKLTADAWDVNQIMRQLLIQIIKSINFTDASKSRISTVLAESQFRLTKGSLQSLQLLNVLTVINHEAQTSKS